MIISVKNPPWNPPVFVKNPPFAACARHNLPVFLKAHSSQLIADKRHQQACARNETTKVASAASDTVGGKCAFAAIARLPCADGDS